VEHAVSPDGGPRSPRALGPSPGEGSVELFTIITFLAIAKGRTEPPPKHEVLPRLRARIFSGDPRPSGPSSHSTFKGVPKVPCGLEARRGASSAGFRGSRGGAGT